MRILALLFIIPSAFASSNQDLKNRCFEKKQGRACIELGTSLWQTPSTRREAIAAFSKGCELKQESGCELKKMNPGPSASPAQPSSSAASTPAPAIGKIRAVAYIRQIAPGRYEVSRTAALANAQDLGRITGSARTEKVEDGYRIEDIAANSVLLNLGLQVGDVVQTVNGQAITSPDAATAWLATLPFTDLYEVKLRRAGQQRTLTYVMAD